MIDKLEDKFIEVYGSKSDYKYFAPGRINLIGEHLDYHGGMVLPAAITLGTYALVSKRPDRTIGLYSLNFLEQGVREFSLDDLIYDQIDDWTNYVKGSISVLGNQVKEINFGFNILYYGDLPNGAGLSSSASLEVLTLYLCNDLFDLGLSLVEIALLGQKVENDYIGVNSGIMDQFAVALGRQDKAILLDTRSLEYDLVESKLDGYSIVIMNTNKKRGLMDSDYNLRRLESEKAFEFLNESGIYDFLTDINLNELKHISENLLDEDLFKRVKHVVSENKRVLDAQVSLKTGNLVEFGKYLKESHLSLKNDYEVTGLELDTLVLNAWEQEGVLGARMTGAGFGGAAIAIVEDSKVHSMIQNLDEIYLETIGYRADFYIAKIGDGVERR